MRSAKPTNGQQRTLRRSDVTSDLSHPIPVGEIVTVVRVSRTAAPFIEGHAVIKEIARGPHCYRVQFSGDPVPRERVIHPDYQTNPELMLQILRDLWRASSTPAVPDFFPEENT